MKFAFVIFIDISQLCSADCVLYLAISLVVLLTVPVTFIPSFIFFIFTRSSVYSMFLLSFAMYRLVVLCLVLCINFHVLRGY